jgi:hypothetical protein
MLCARWEQSQRGYGASGFQAGKSFWFAAQCVQLSCHFLDKESFHVMAIGRTWYHVDLESREHQLV